MALSLTQKIVRLHDALDRAPLPHAFGGALALAFCTQDPRATHDIDVNVFVGPDRVNDVLEALPSEVVAGEPERSSLQRDGQVRMWWDGTPVDVFLSSHAFHDEAEARSRTVPFADVGALPVLGCNDLAVFKASYARPQDAVDIAAMVEAGTLDTGSLLTCVAGLLGSDHPAVEFVNSAIAMAPDRP